MRKQDKQLIANINQNPNTKKMFKRQQKLDDLDHIAKNQRQAIVYSLIAYIFLAISIIITACLYHYYLIPYWNHLNFQHANNLQTGWEQFKAFFIVHQDLGATFGIVFCVVSALLVSYVLIATLKFFFKCLTNMWVFKRSFIFWFFLTLLAWIPVLNILVMLLAMHKYSIYGKLKISNQVQLSSTYTINELNRQVAQASQVPTIFQAPNGINGGFNGFSNQYWQNQGQGINNY